MEEPTPITSKGATALHLCFHSQHESVLYIYVVMLNDFIYIYRIKFKVFTYISVVILLHGINKIITYDTFK